MLIRATVRLTLSEEQFKINYFQTKDELNFLLKELEKIKPADEDVISEKDIENQKIKLRD